MTNIRTANKRHKRTVVLQYERSKAADKGLVEDAKPAKASRKS